MSGSGVFRFFPEPLPESPSRTGGESPLTARNDWATSGQCIVIGINYCCFVELRGDGVSGLDPGE